MAKNINSSCDNCGTVLFGKDKSAFISKDNVFVNGQIGKNTIDPDSKYRETVYMTRTKEDRLIFCDNNYECLIEWMEKQVELFRNRKVAALRKRAEGEHMERLATGGYNIDRRPQPPPRYER